MNIYDFDDTIYDGDTFIEMIKYSIFCYPFITLKSIITSIPYFIKYKNGKCSFELFKEKLFSFLFKIDNLDNHIEKFIDKNIHKIKKWYLINQKDNDLVVSASLSLWIKPFCERIGIKNVIATDMDSNGKIIGKNCKRDEKVKRIEEKFGDIKIDNAYSDSLSDLPMLLIAKNAFIVEGNKLIKYTEGYNFKRKR